MTVEIIGLLIFDFAIILTPFMLYYFPPKDINPIYGYKTKRSMKNIKNWKFSQKYFARQFIPVPLIIIFTQFTLMLTTNIDLKEEPPLIPLISVAELIIGTIFCAFATESKLKDMEGKP